MADFHSDNEQPVGQDADLERGASPAEAGRLDRRSFLRALSGSALTIVAGGLTVSLAACQGASTSNPLIGSVGIAATTPPLPTAPSGSGTSLGGGLSSTSRSSGSSGSSGSNSSGSSSSSSGIAPPSSPTFRRLAVASLQPQDYQVDSWNTRA